ncbi:fructosamine kinase family protein [Sphingobacterium oryzagri]|uniref:Fructosamine kinase family protein n=1 Tax=Sphingobacterium oryzagri TaxID=3025669 RepID=A0ABY7WLP9_9SPHI|nr:fructosamine kinase family protein [Sphingobacterium sp. KACC 22765]WDF70518.1 fructosamine kinase family protein [Sphingobacterium sp. KACC 22765]
MNLKSVLEECLNQVVVRVKPIHSGHVNDAYKVLTKDRCYFLKVNREIVFSNYFVQERAGLAALKEAFQHRVPEVVGVFEHDGAQLLIMEYIESGNANEGFWTDFGQQLAAMHRKSDASFGWHDNNYIGNLPQENTRNSCWSSFYTENRILPLVRKMQDMGVFSNKQIQQAEKLCLEINNILPKEAPALIHGDLWSGNFLIDKKGLPVLIDPSISFSHREMDIGMTKLFGGFPAEFYAAYTASFPLAPGWEARLPVMQLYPLLVHATLFGGGYVGRCVDTLATFN